MSPNTDPLYTDLLTGLASRWVASERLREARERREAITVMAIEMDHFRRVNEHYGHLRGDAALVKVAGVLKSIAVECATVARYTGDGFLIVVPGVTAEDILPLAEWLREAIKSNLREYGLSASIGVADSRQVPLDGSTEEAAHSAVEEARHRGRDRVVVYGGD